MHKEHLTTAEVAAYLEKDLSDSERERVERHLVHCLECRREIVQVQTIAGASASRRGLYVGFAAMAAAAVVVLMVFGSSGSSTFSSTGEPRIRGLDAERTVPIDVVSPENGERVDRQSLTFLWHAVATGTSYRVTLTNAQGDVLWNDRSSDTSIVVPERLGLIEGNTYYWYVDALLADGAPATTGVQRFVLAR